MTNRRHPAAPRLPVFGYGIRKWGGTYIGDLTVTCGGLTPGATYRTSAGSFRASTTGNGTATVTGIYPPSNISVAREETQADGSVELIVVLEGTLKVH